MELVSFDSRKKSIHHDFKKLRLRLDSSSTPFFTIFFSFNWWVDVRTKKYFVFTAEIERRTTLEINKQVGFIALQETEIENYLHKLTLNIWDNYTAITVNSNLKFYKLNKLNILP